MPLKMFSGSPLPQRLSGSRLALVACLASLLSLSAASAVKAQCADVEPAAAQNDAPVAVAEAEPISTSSGLELSRRTLNLAPHRVATPKTSKRESYEYTSVILAAKPDSGSYLAWTDQDWNSHLIALDAQDQPSGKDMIFPNRVVLAISAHEQGFAVLVTEPTTIEGYSTLSNYSLELISYDKQGRQRFARTLIANADIRDTGATVLDNWGNYQLVWSGSHFAAYVATSHNFGSREKPDIHQGDALFMVDAAGELVNPDYKSELIDGQTRYYSVGGWDWNVSHSFEQRLVSNGAYFAMLAKGDAYPRGMALNLRPDPSVAASTDAQALNQAKLNLFPIKGEIGENYTPIALGDMVILDDTLWISFSTSEDRGSYDVGLMQVDWQGKVLATRWLTETPAIDETSVKMARYGDELAIAWKSFSLPENKIRADYSQHTCCEVTHMGVLNAQGYWRVPPETIATDFNFNHVIHERKQIHIEDEAYDNYNGGQFVTYPDGHVAWAESIRNPQEIVIHRLAIGQ